VWSRWSARSEARTYDLDATVGRRILVADGECQLGCETGSGPVLASGPSRGGGGG
jgi:hypothetical protein